MRNKGLIIALIVVLVVIGIGVSVMLANLLGGKFNFNFGGISDELVFDEVYRDNFERISIKTDASQIEIKASSDDTYRVVVYGDKEQTNVSANSEKLTVDIKSKKCFGICFNFKASKVEVYVPKNYNHEINVFNSYGDIEIDKFMNAYMSIEAKAGDIDIEGGYEVDVKNDYGDIDVVNARTLRLDESCGDVDIGEVEYLEAKNDYGDIKVERVTNYMSIDQSCGDVKIGSVDLKNNSRIKNNLGSIEIGSTNEIYINARVDLGDIKINNNYRDADFELNLENNCGDIKVNN